MGSALHRLHCFYICTYDTRSILFLCFAFHFFFSCSLLLPEWLVYNRGLYVNKETNTVWNNGRHRPSCYTPYKYSSEESCPNLTVTYAGHCCPSQNPTPTAPRSIAVSRLFIAIGELLNQLTLFSCCRLFFSLSLCYCCAAEWHRLIVHQRISLSFCLSGLQQSFISCRRYPLKIRCIFFSPPFYLLSLLSQLLNIEYNLNHGATSRQTTRENLA